MTAPKLPPEQNDLELCSDQDDELLTAFLDGELTASEKADTEKRLETDPNLKKRLEQLRAAGRFLDSLELVPLNKEMTAATMELLTGIVKREIQESEKKRRRQNLILIPLVFLTAAISFFAVGRWLQKPADPFRHDPDYKVFSHLDALEAVQTISFLRKLQEIPFFNGTDEETSDENADEPSSETKPDNPPQNADTKKSRQFPYEPVPNDLFLKRTRFYSFSETEQEKYRKFWAEIEAAPDRSQLEPILERFSAWFWNLRDPVRYHLWTQPEEKRIEFVKKFIERMKEIPDSFPPPPGEMNRFSGYRNKFENDKRSFGRYRFNLKLALPKEVRNENLDVQEDFDAYIDSLWNGESPKEFMNEKPKRAVLDSFIEEKGIDYFLEKLSDDGRAYVETIPDPQKKKLFALLMMIKAFNTEQENTDSAPSDPPNSPPKPIGPNGQYMPPPPPPRQNLGYFWKTESTADLAETLRRLPEGTREELLNLPAEEMYSQLLILHWGFDPKTGPPRFGRFRGLPPPMPNQEIIPPQENFEELNQERNKPQNPPQGEAAADAEEEKE